MRLVVPIMVAILALACRRAPRPVYEYEDVTTVSTDAPKAPAASSTTTLPSSRPSTWRKGGAR